MMMKILQMENKHFDAVARIDQVAFGRGEARRGDNLEALLSSDPEGCFVLEVNSQVIGFIFTKVMGEEGYFGPVAVLPEYQRDGFGKVLIARSLEYLKAHCKVIGLEVFPELGQNVGLYHKLGFGSGFPSLRFELLENLDRIGNFKGLQMSMLTFAEQVEIDNELGQWTEGCFGGVCYSKDLQTALKSGGHVVIAYKDDEPAGFLADSPVLLPYLWGVARDEQVMEALLREIRHARKGERLLIEVNARYRNLVELLGKMGCTVIRSVNRMLLAGYEGDYLKESSQMSMRAWIG
ncbi:MAG: N-acetyltransferase [Clostridia bacterium]|nr:N-acetyltransferase [Clostridia bacterium]